VGNGNKLDAVLGNLGWSDYLAVALVMIASIGAMRTLP
jgi:hypothetical protein